MKDKTKRKTSNIRPVDARTRARAKAGVRRRKHRLRRYTLYYILLLLLVLGAMVTLSLTVFFNIKSFSVQCDRYTQEEIIQASGVEIGDNLFRLNTQQIEQKLIKKFVYLDEVQVKQKLPSTLEIACTTAKVKYNVATGDTFAALSAGGRLLETDKTEQDADAIQLVGIGLSEVKAGDYLAQTDQKNRWESLQELQAVLEELEFGEITRMDLTHEDAIVLCYQDRLLITLDDLASARRVLTLSQKIIADKIGEQETGRIFYNPNDQSIHFVSEPIS